MIDGYDMLDLMARKRRTYHLDERVIEALQSIARKNFTSANRYLEEVLFDLAKKEGELPKDALPLGELRGGDRTSGDDE
ncbi:MAG: hypothetical protein F6J97_08205 [Leptolyngbya sp. SIO4C1]|nr:hypothetical protein [Leptolyngbya sp. SIO4C1]